MQSGTTPISKEQINVTKALEEDEEGGEDDKA
jgi:hypothetical protein